MWFLPVSCLLMLLACIATNVLLQRSGGPPASSGFMKSLLWIVEFAFGCHHRQMSRVFTIKKRMYQVCFGCGQEFDYSWALMHPLRTSIADNSRVQLGLRRSSDSL